MRRSRLSYEDYVTNRSRSDTAYPGYMGGQPDVYDPNTDPNRRVSMEMAALDAQRAKNITEYTKVNMARDPLAIAYQKDLMRTKGQELANVEGIRWRKPMLKKGGGFDIWDPQSMQVVPGPAGADTLATPNYGKYLEGGPSPTGVTPSSPGTSAVQEAWPTAVKPPESVPSWDPYGMSGVTESTASPVQRYNLPSGMIPRQGATAPIAQQPQSLAQPPLSASMKKRIRPDGTIELYNYDPTDTQGQQFARPGEYNPQDIVDLSNQQMYQYNPRYGLPYRENDEAE